jgi:hypothetical protein
MYESGENMHSEPLTAPAATIAKGGVVVALKREERPLSHSGTGTLCCAVQRMTVQEFGNLSLSRGIRPSEILAERELRRAASVP